MSNEFDFDKKEEQSTEETMNQPAEETMNQPAEETVNQPTEEMNQSTDNEDEVNHQEVQEEVPESGVVPVQQEQREDEQQGTYHWVNPKLQRDGERGETNSYENQSYREPINGYSQNHIYQNREYQNQGYQNQQRNNGYQGGGYQGGSYHEWQNQQRMGGIPEQGPKTGERHYGKYSFEGSQGMETSKQPKPPKEKKPMGTGKKFLVTAGMAVVFGVIAGSVMFGVNSLGNKLTRQDKKVESHLEIPKTEKAPTQSDSAVSTNHTGGGYTVAQVASECMPSVVSITNASVSTVRDFFGGVQEYPMESSGSGIIVGQNDSELLIATNNHVVDGAKTLTVAFSDAAVCEAQTKGTDPNKDLAVIAVKLADMSPETLNAIKIVRIGDSDALEIGEQVVAIGNALGYGQSVTSGWVSAKERQLTDENGEIIENLIQTDTAINPGNSGGALLNMHGELIGINVAKTNATAVEGMGYAIPVSIATPILDELMNRETRYKTDEKNAAYIGVSCLNVDASAVQMYGIPEGAFVESVEEGGPAEVAGIQKGDVITKFDGLSVTSSSELVDRISYYKAGEEIEICFARAEGGEYKEQTVVVKLGRRSQMKQTQER